MKLSSSSRERLAIKAHNAGYRAPNYENQTVSQYEFSEGMGDRRLVYSTEPRKESQDFDIGEALIDSEGQDQLELAFERERALEHIED